MFWKILIKFHQGPRTFYSECDHKHRSIDAARRCQRRLARQKPDDGVTIAFVELRLIGGVS